MFSLDVFLYINLVVVFAYVIKTHTGFGENMVMIPLLLLLLDFKVVLPLTLTIVLVADGYLWYRLRGEVDYGIFLRLIIPAVGGVAIGTLGLSFINTNILEKIAGGFVSLYAGSRLLITQVPGGYHKSSWLTYLAGFTGGSLSGMIGMGGPPIIAYLNDKGMSKQVFRATCVVTLACFDPLRLIAYHINGTFTCRIFLHGLTLIPAFALGSYMGMWIHNRMGEKVFQQTVALFLLAIGIILLV